MSSRVFVPERGHLIYINHSPAEGDEIPDVRPLLVISARAFNERTGMVIGFPMTHAARHETNPFAVPVRLKNTDPVSYILANQPKSFDWRARNAGPHPSRGPHPDMMKKAIGTLDSICGIVDLLNDS